MLIKQLLFYLKISNKLEKLLMNLIVITEIALQN